MRRLVSLVLIIMLALVGCSRPATTVSPVPRLSSTPTAGPTSSPTGATPLCHRLHPPVAAARADRRGPFGVMQVTGTDAVALTFDDGPDPVNTPILLDLLRECGVRATFCVVGVKVAPNADVVRRIVAEGHTLCNHSWWHNSKLGTYGQAAIRDDLQRTTDAIHSVVPDAPVVYFRAPGGLWTRDYVTVAREVGMTSLDWDVDPWDWNFPVWGRGEAMINHIVAHVESHVRPGSIILSHDYQKPTTIAAYRILLPWLTARFELVALPTSQP